MSWQLLILSSVLLYSVAVVIQRYLLRDNKSDPIAYSIFFQLLVGVLVAIFGYTFADMTFGKLGSIALNLVIMVILYSAANVLTFNALKIGEASKFTILFSTRAFFTVFASTLILGESLTFVQIVGVLFIFLSVVLVNLDSSKFHLGKFELMSFLAAIVFGLANTNDRIILKTVNLYPYVTVAFIVPALFMMFLYPRSLNKMRLFMSFALLKKMIIFSLIYAASAVTFFAALQKSNNSSQVATVNLTSVILTVILSIIFLKENKRIWLKIIGAILSFVGLTLIS